MTPDKPRPFSAMVDSVICLPQGNAEERLAKKRGAQALRHQAYLGSANCILQVLDLFYRYPHINLVDTISRLRSNAVITDVLALDSWLSELRNTSQAVGTVSRDLDRLAKKEETGMEAIMFTWAVGSAGEQGNNYLIPRGRVELDTLYPLAMVIQTHARDDFKMLEARQGVLGFYRDRYYMLSSGGSYSAVTSYPVIGTIGTGNTRTLRHEKAHAENWPFWHAGEDETNSIRWAKYRRFQSSIVKRLKKSWDTDADFARASFDWKQVLSYTWARAKDELLASFAADYQGKDMLAQCKGLLSSEVYDYFQQMGFNRETALYRALWFNYSKILAGNALAATLVVDTYQRLLLQARLRQFRWVLAQIPLEDWGKVLRNSLFYQEAGALTEIFEILASRKDPRLQQFLEDCRRQQTGSLFTIIDSTDKYIDELPQSAA